MTDGEQPPDPYSPPSREHMLPVGGPPHSRPEKKKKKGFVDLAAVEKEKENQRQKQLEKEREKLTKYRENVRLLEERAAEAKRVTKATVQTIALSLF